MIAKALGLSALICFNLAPPHDPPQPTSLKSDPQVADTGLPLLRGESKNATSLKCSEDLQTLTPLLLRDLPNYANRVIQRSRSLPNSPDLKAYVLLAGKAEYEPLDLGTSKQFQPTTDNTAQQIFFTTLERQYINQKAVEIQNYHWLFLTPSPDGWRLGMSLTRFGTLDKTNPPSPPRDTSNAVIGQAVKLWLRDCRAGTIKQP